MESAYLRLVNLSRYFSSGGLLTMALKNITLDIQRGEFVAVMGPSGCGKTTLLNILGLIDVSTSGHYFFSGTEITGLKERERVALRRGNIGFVFQNFNLIDDLTVYQNIELPLVYLKIGAGKRRQLVEEAIERLQITMQMDYFPWQLSGGQQQQVAIARAIVAKPKLILADEPTGNLDSISGTKIMEILSGLNREDTTIVMVTHSERDADYASRIIQLFDGRIIHESAQRFLTKSKQP